MQAASPSILFYAGALDGMFQERTGASATTPSGVDDPVGSLKNYGSLEDWAVTTTSDSARPRLRNVAGKYRIATDGIDDLLRILFTQAQPFVRVSSFAGISIPTNAQIFGGGSINRGALYNRSGNFGIFSGVEMSGSTPVGTSTYLVEERHSGLTSRKKIGTGSYTTGNAGTDVSGGMSLGSQGGTAASFAAAGYYAVVAWSGVEPSAEDLDLARRFCAQAAGITL